MTTSRQIVFVDQNVSDLHSLLANLRPDVEPIVLTASERATAQIATALKGRDDLHAIHIVAHGSAGEVRFGAGALSRETLDDHAAELAEIGRALGRDGQLSLWSCETGQGERGAAFVEALERATGADVAATAGLVGSAARGGRWELDSGFAQAPLTLEGMAAYAGVMSTHLESFSLTAITEDAGPDDFVTNDHTLILSGSLNYNGSDGTNQVTSFEIWLSGGEFGATSTFIGTFSFPPGFLPGDPSSTSTIDWSYDLGALPIANLAQSLLDGTYTLLLKEPGGGGGPLPVTAGGNANFTINSNLDYDPPTAAVDITAIANDTGTAGDFLTSDTTLTVSGTHGPLGAGEKVQVSSNGGTTWSDVTTSDATTWSFTDPTPHATSFTYQARIIDLAANVGTTDSQLVTIDTTAPTAALDITAITDDTGAADFTTSDTTLTVSGTNGALGAGEKVQVSNDGGVTWNDVVQGAGTWSYVDPATHATSFTYQARVIDAAANVGTTDSQLVTIDTTAPTAALDITAITDDTGAADFTTSDTTLTVSGTNGALGAGEKVQVSNDGGVTWNDVVQGAGTWSYVDPATHATSFTYQARVIDAAANVGSTDSQAVTIDTSVSEAAVDITAITDDTGTADFKTSDTTLTVSGTNGALAADERVQVSNDGGLTWNDVVQGAGTWSYVDPDTHAADFTYLARVIDAADNVGDTDSQEIIINQPPDAVDDADTVAEGAAKITVNVLTNDTDSDSILTFGSITAFTQGANGTVVNNGDGTFTYSHNGSETTSDSFTYTITDDAGDTDTATVNLTVTPVNDTPFVATAIPDQTSPRQAFWQFQFAASAFGDVDGPAALTYTAKLGNGDPLPYWLTFDAATRTFSGTPPRDGALNQAIALQVTASDGLASVSDTFNLNLNGNIAGLNQDSGGFVPAAFQFTNAGDTYTASNIGEVANALAGDDVVNGGLGNDTINGNFGEDKIDGGGGQNILHGDEGNDYVSSTGNLNIAFGDRGADQLYFNGDQNQLFGGDTLFNDNDWLGVNGTNNALTGGFGDEVWIGASGNANTLNGDAGNDLVFANGIGNYLYGGIGDDWLGVSGSFNVLQGQQGDDYVAATGNFNTLDGGAGNDTLLAGAHIRDRFVFHDGYGIDNIVNFARHGAGGFDVIDLNGFGLNFSSLQSYLSDVGGNATITINAATILTIQGVTKAQLLDSDFLF